MFHRRKPVPPKGPTLRLDSPDPIPIMEPNPPRMPWLSEFATRAGSPIAQWFNAQDRADARVSFKLLLMTFTEVLHSYFSWVSAHLPENQLIRFVFHVSMIIFLSPVVLYLLVLLLFTSAGILVFLSIFLVVSGATTVAFIPVIAITLGVSLLGAFIVSLVYLGYTGFTAEEGWVRRVLAPLADLLPPSVGVSEAVKGNGSVKVATVTEIDPDDERIKNVSNGKVPEQQATEQQP